MSNKTSLKTSFVSAVICIFVSLCFVQSVNAGSIVSWGDRRFDGRDFENAQFQAIAAGHWYSIALKSDGSIAGWGDDIYGQASPPAGNDFIAIAAGYYQSLALKADGFIAGWGRDDYGQASPPAGNDFAAIAAGGYHSLAITKSYAGDFVSPYGVDFLDFAVLGLVWYSQPGDGNWNAICDISEPNDAE